MNEYFSDEAKALYCSECNAQKRKRRDFEVHFKRYHAVPDIVMRPDVHDPNLYCSTCQKTLRSKVSFREHMQLVHTLNPDLQYTRLDSSLLPDADDPENYCKVCQRHLFSRGLFEIHLKKEHGMNTCSSSKASGNATRENYCFVCKLQLPGSVSYIRHLRVEHKELNLNVSSKRKRSDSDSEKEEVDPLKKRKEESTKPKTHQFGTVFQPGLMPDELATDPNCFLCKKKYSDLGSYRRHLHYAHKKYVTYRPVTPDNVPDPRHPYFYCSICEKRAVNERSFHYHLRSIHYMEFQS
ncbi:hypothetical protein HPULCUR_003321 [Helicostylum pulchrum]|uniref:C2H2-type domain-containing protein n=1 Tax=Helicostylum pulchrum TaxID=562976 RepID=A0ABP9XT25_9FUNG